MTVEAPTSHARLIRLARRFRVIYIVPVMALLALGVWAFASPIGASPDDDYHLASIWCANEARTDLCAPDPVNGDGWRLVLPGLMTSPCYVADGEASAGCQEWSSALTPSVPADHGNWGGAYPPVYYAVMNIFASTDIQTAALVMRLFNVLLFVGFTTALALLLPRSLRVPLIAGWVITAVPLGVFLIASINPGSWALIGVGGSWLAALGWFRATGKRFWALGAMTVVGVILAAGARTDAAVYSILGLGIASFISAERTRRYGFRLILPAVLVIIAALFFRSSGYSQVAEGGLTGGIPNPEARNPLSVLAFNLVSIPQLWTGVFGSWGLGWKMEVWPGFAMVEFATLAVFIGLASLGIQSMQPRKVVMVLALVATLYLLPTYILTVGVSVVGENVQPRYILPLVVVLGGLLLLTLNSERPFRPHAWHVVPAMILLIVANTIALYTTLRRYITGFDVQQASLESGAEWWWTGFPITPTAVWIIGSVLFAAVIIPLGLAWLRESHRAEATA